jgi:hypothetical protein
MIRPSVTLLNTFCHLRETFLHLSDFPLFHLKTAREHVIVSFIKDVFLKRIRKINVSHVTSIPGNKKNPLPYKCDNCSLKCTKRHTFDA